MYIRLNIVEDVSLIHIRTRHCIHPGIRVNIRSLTFYVALTESVFNSRSYRSMMSHRVKV